MEQETTFCALRCKEVINLSDGKKLGRPLDIVIDLKCGKIRGILVPGESHFSLFRRCDELFIPWGEICKIGEDVIIVQLKMPCPAPKVSRPGMSCRSCEQPNQSLATQSISDDTDAEPSEQS